MKKDFPPLNIEIPETVKREDDRLAEDPDAILRLVDLLFFWRGGRWTATSVLMGKPGTPAHPRRAVFLSIYGRFSQRIRDNAICVAVCPFPGSPGKGP